MKVALIFVLVTLSLYVVAQDQSFNYEPMSIDGQFNSKMTPAERIKRLRARLEKQNELLVKKKIESLRLKQELEMSRRLQAMFNKQLKALEGVN